MNPSLPHSQIILEMSLTQVLPRSLLFNLQILGGFPACLLLLISSSVSLWSKNMLCMISLLLFWSSFKFVRMCFLVKDAVSLGECSM